MGFVDGYGVLFFQRREQPFALLAAVFLRLLVADDVEALFATRGDRCGNAARDLDEGLSDALDRHEQIWLQMMRDRNSTSDIYDEAKAQEIYSRIREYQPRFRVVYSLLEKKK